VPGGVKRGVTGLKVKPGEEAVAAVRQSETIERWTVRGSSERRFSVEVMAKNYELAYGGINAMRENLDMSAKYEGLNGLMPLPRARMGNG
jgi:hypothetical protein